MLATRRSRIVEIRDKAWDTGGPQNWPTAEQQKNIRATARTRLPSRPSADRGTYIDFAVLVEDPSLVPEFNDTHFNPTVLVPTQDLVHNLTAAFAAARPQFVVTIGDRARFRFMQRAPLQMRHGWAHFSDPNEFTARALESLYWHALHYSGGEPGEALVSAYTHADAASEADLVRTYDSLLRQSHENWEWLVYYRGDGGEQGAWSWLPQDQMAWNALTRLAASDYRVRPLRGSPNDDAMSCPQRMMFGDANGELLAEVAAGGELLPGALSLLSAAAQDHPSAALFYADHALGDWPDADALAFVTNASHSGAALYHEISFSPGSPGRPPTWATHWSLFRLTPKTAASFAYDTARFLAWRRSAYNELGGHASGLPFAADFELVTRMARHNRSAVHVQHPVYKGPPSADAPGTGAVDAAVRRYVDIIAGAADLTPAAADVGPAAAGVAPAAADVVPAVAAHIKGTAPNVRAPAPAAAAPSNSTAAPFWDVWRPSGVVPLARPWRLEVSQSSARAPFISVIIPTFDQPDSLWNAIRSVYAQSYKHWELVIVGDGCPQLNDFMQQHASFFAYAGHHVRWFNMPTQGNATDLHAPLNYGAKALASGSWIAYLSDLDAWTPDHLASLVRLVVQDPARSFAFASLQIGPKVVLCEQPKLRRINTSALLHRADLIARYGGWRPVAGIPLGYGQDWDFVSRWVDGGERWAASLQPTVLYRSLLGVAEDPLADRLITAYDAFIH